MPHSRKESSQYAVLPEVPKKYQPPNTLSSSEKTLWTERKLMAVQTELQKLFSECGNTEPTIGRKKRNKSEVDIQPFVGCSTCYNRKCDSLVEDMYNYLLPYSESIYKHRFIANSSVEEMERVVLGSVLSLVTDIWGKKKYIKVSFGASVKWKMIYFLYGDHSIYNDSDIVCIDQETERLHNPHSDDDNVYNLVYALSNTTDSFAPDMFTVTRRFDIVDSIMSCLFSYRQELSQYLESQQVADIEMRVVHGVCRLLSNKDTYTIFKGHPKAQYYYYKFVDFLYKFLKDYAQGS